MNGDLSVDLYGPDNVAVARALCDLVPGNLGLPNRVTVGTKSPPVAEDWFDRAVADNPVSFGACWEAPSEEWDCWVFCSPQNGVALNWEKREIDPVAMLELLSRLPFAVGTAGTVHESWEVDDPRYKAPSFGDLHNPLGWACFFKGEGHERLVSRRWLDYGPWHVVRGPEDTTMVQFHDVEADAATALAQAQPGHRRMAVPGDGGFLHSTLHVEREIQGLYVKDERRLKIVVHEGRTLSAREMWDARMVQHHQAFGDKQPLDAIAYVFIAEEDACAHLHELWLRDLQCWVFRDGVETRLDDDYVPPPPEPPDWVNELTAR